MVCLVKAPHKLAIPVADFLVKARRGTILVLVVVCLVKPIHRQITLVGVSLVKARRSQLPVAVGFSDKICRAPILVGIFLVKVQSQIIRAGVFLVKIHNLAVQVLVSLDKALRPTALEPVSLAKVRHSRTLPLAVSSAASLMHNQATPVVVSSGRVPSSQARLVAFLLAKT